MKLITPTQLSPDEVKDIVRAYFKEALNRLEKQCDTNHDEAHILAGVLKCLKKNLPSDKLEAMQSYTPEAHTERLDFLVPSDYLSKKGEDETTLFKPFYFNGDPEAVLQYLLRNNDLEIAEYSPTYRGLKKGVERAVCELKSQQQRLLDFETLDIQDAWFKDAVEPVKAVTVQSEYVISACFEQYMAEHSNAPKKTNDKRRNSYDIWIELFGDSSISGFSKNNVWEYLETLKAYPKNRQQKYPNKSLDQLKKLNLSRSDCLAVSTINNHISMMKAYVSWLKKWKDFSNDNPFYGVNLKDTVPDDQKRDSFTEDQLIKIFSTPVYQGCKSASDRGQYIKGEKTFKNSKFWLPLMGLYSGARLGELCQLHIKDIQQEDGIWFFDINQDEDGKSLKTYNSARKVPIHPKLIDLGFIQYVEDMKKKGESRVFPDVQKANDGKYSTVASKRFATFLKKFDIKTEKTSFHSFRHTFIKAIANIDGISSSDWEEITGHSDGQKKVGVEAYRGALKVRKVHDSMKKLNYPFLNELLKILEVG